MAGRDEDVAGGSPTPPLSPRTTPPSAPQRSTGWCVVARVEEGGREVRRCRYRGAGRWPRHWLCLSKASSLGAAGSGGGGSGHHEAVAVDPAATRPGGRWLLTLRLVKGMETVWTDGGGRCMAAARQRTRQGARARSRCRRQRLSSPRSDRSRSATARCSVPACLLAHLVAERRDSCVPPERARGTASVPAQLRAAMLPQREAREIREQRGRSG